MLAPRLRLLHNYDRLKGLAFEPFGLFCLTSIGFPAGPEGGLPLIGIWGSCRLLG